MRVPPELKDAADLALVVRFQAPGLGTYMAVRPWKEVAASPPDADGYQAMAAAAQKAGDHVRTARIYADAVAAYPADSELLNGAAWYLVTCPEQHRQPARAVTLAREAVRLSQGRSYHIVDTLAEALLVDGRLDEAQAENERLLRLQPGFAGGVKRAARIAAARKPAP